MRYEYGVMVWEETGGNENVGNYKGGYMGRLQDGDIVSVIIYLCIVLYELLVSLLVTPKRDRFGRARE